MKAGTEIRLAEAHTLPEIQDRAGPVRDRIFFLHIVTFRAKSITHIICYVRWQTLTEKYYCCMQVLNAKPRLTIAGPIATSAPQKHDS